MDQVGGWVGPKLFNLSLQLRAGGDSAYAVNALVCFLSAARADVVHGTNAVCSHTKNGVSHCWQIPNVFWLLTYGGSIGNKADSNDMEVDGAATSETHIGLLKVSQQ